MGLLGGRHVRQGCAPVQRPRRAAQAVLDQSSTTLSHTRVPHLPPPVAPLPAGVEVRPLRDLARILRQIDGWGEHGWRLIHGAWRLPNATLVIEPREADGDPLVTVVLPSPLRSTGSADAIAIADWALTQLRTQVVAPSTVRCVTATPQQAVRATTAAFLLEGNLCLRLMVRLPFAGLCCDGQRFRRFVGELARFATGLRADAALKRLRRCVAIQEALREALPRHGLIAFLATGSRLARDANDGPAPHCRPLRVPPRLATTIDLGPLGRWRGLGIRTGVTALVGAPYHGKSTLVQAIAAGCDNHRPGDGREGVVCVHDALVVQADEGRRIVRQDVRTFFAQLPGAQARCFTTERASGATSMAASVFQGVAAGARVLLIDEDTAAGNFLWLDPAMRRLLGRSVRGGSTLCDQLRTLAAAGISCVLAVGSATPVLGRADRVLMVEDFQPRDVSARARRLAGIAPTTALPFPLPSRWLDSPSETILEGRHFVRVDALQPDQPILHRQRDALHLDLRRCGFALDEELTRGALAAAAWCVRLADGQPTTMTELATRYAALLDQTGPRALDPYATTLVTAPPWLLVAAILERLPELRWR